MNICPSLYKESVADYELGFVVLLKKKLGFVIKKSEKKKWKKKDEVLQQNYRCAIVESQAQYKCQQLKKKKPWLTILRL